jgi:hypothetical protein
LFAVAILAVLLAASLFSPVAAVGYVVIKKTTTNGDTTTIFHFIRTNPDGSVHPFDLTGGERDTSPGVVPPGVYKFMEVDVPPGWVLTSVYCEGFIMVPNPSTFTYISGGVIIGYVAEDSVTCVFTNSPAAAVGGVVTPANNFAILAPWLALIGVVGCIGTVVVVARRRK